MQDEWELRKGEAEKGPLKHLLHFEGKQRNSLSAFVSTKWRGGLLVSSMLSTVEFDCVTLPFSDSKMLDL